jgi:hypothetical protein
MPPLLLLLCTFGNSAQAASAPTPALVGVARIWDGGAHNAFTDFIRWRDRWYCTFREGDDHVGGDDRIRVLVSEDSEKWTSTALIGETRIDLRDQRPDWWCHIWIPYSVLYVEDIDRRESC